MRTMIWLALAAYLLWAEPLAISMAERDMETNNLVARHKLETRRLKAMEGRVVPPECLTALMDSEEWCGPVPLPPTPWQDLEFFPAGDQIDNPPPTPRSEQERLVERLKLLREQFQEETPSGMEPTRPLFCEHRLDGKWVKVECPPRRVQ